MEVYLMRHGIQASADVDPEKRLSHDGIKQGHMAALALNKLNLRFDLVLSSPKARALQTAEIVCKEVDYPLDRIIVTPILEPEEPAKEVFAYLQSCADKEKVLIVGHLPSLMNVASYILGYSSPIEIRFEPVTVCRIDVDNGFATTGSLRWLLMSEHFQLMSESFCSRKG